MSRTSTTRLGAFALSLLLVGFLVVTGSRAAFTDTTDNTGNAFAAGTLALVDDDGGATALFSVANMVPGDSVTDCIEVTYQGSITNPAAVKLYSSGYTDSGDFADYLNVTIEEGSPGTFQNCSTFSADDTIETGGTLVDFDTDHTNYTNGAGAWDPAGTPESKTYRFTVELDAATPDAEQGETVTALAFTWEVQS